MNELETAILDCNSRYYSMDTIQLMENAGRSAAEEIEKRYGPRKKIGVFCGLGNNGGDGFVAARFLASSNEVTVYLLGKPEDIQTAEARRNWDILQHTSAEKVGFQSRMSLPQFDVIVDALLGTGITGELREPYKSVVETLNALPGEKVSVDIPTGYRTSTSFAADLTLSMHYPKTENCVTVTLGVPREFETLVGPGDVRFLKKRRKDSHKGDNGRVLIIGGSPIFHGAPIYAAMAASTIVDLTLVACPLSAAPIVKAASPDFIVHPLSSEHVVLKDVPLILELSDSCDSVLIGPGLGMDEETQKACRTIISELKKKKKTIIVDADGLKALKDHTDLIFESMVLTPHRGEFAMLFSDDPVEKAAALHHCTIVQKAPVDIISNGVKTKYNYTGNAGMTTGGTGDVLAGLITGFSATNDPFQASCAAAFVNGLAGDRCYEQVGFHFTSSDVVRALKSVLLWCDTF